MVPFVRSDTERDEDEAEEKRLDEEQPEDKVRRDALMEERRSVIDGPCFMCRPLGRSQFDSFSKSATSWSHAIGRTVHFEDRR